MGAQKSAALTKKRGWKILKQGNGAFFGPKKRRKGHRSRETALSSALSTLFFWEKKHGKGDQGFATRFARIDSRESFAIESPVFSARQADSHESLEFPIRANQPIRGTRANRFARITPLGA